MEEKTKTLLWSEVHILAQTSSYTSAVIGNFSAVTLLTSAALCTVSLFGSTANAAVAHICWLNLYLSCSDNASRTNKKL